MSTRLPSSRIVASRSPISTEVADDKDVVVALVVEAVTDDEVVEAVIDDSGSQDVRVAVATTIEAKPVTTEANDAKPEPIAGEVSQRPRGDHAPAIEQPAAPDITEKMKSGTPKREAADTQPQQLDKPATPTATKNHTGDTPQNDSVPAKSETKTSDSEKTEAYRIEQSVDLVPLVNETERPSKPAVSKRHLEQPEEDIESPIDQVVEIAATETVSVPFIAEPSQKIPAKPRKKRKKPEPNRPKIVDPVTNVSSVELSDPEPPPVLTYAEWFRERISQSKWMTTFFAFYTHWLLLIVLALLVVHGPNSRGDFTITATNVKPLEYEPVDVIDTRIVEPEPEISEVNSRTSPTLPIDMSVSSPTLPDAFIAEETAPGAVDEPNKTNVTESQMASLSPANAMKQGSFSVWTEPEFPDPGESYKVVIRAKVPEGVKRFPVNDLQGVVIGSDGYRKHIPGSLKGFLPIRGGYIQFEVPIVAANQEIKDTVWIQSKMLKEQQKLIIEF